MKSRNVLLIGYDTNICLGVLFCLKDLNGSIHLLTNKKNNPAKHSKFLSGGYYEYNSEDKEEQIIDKIIEIIKDNRIDLIMPIGEGDGRLVSKHKEVLNQHSACTFLPEIDKFDIGVNKRRLAEELLKNNIPCPSFTIVSNGDQLFVKAEEYGYPVLVKPSRGASGRMIKKIVSKSELEDFLKTIENDNEFILQPYINGSDIDCSVLCKDGEIICYTIQQGISDQGDSFKPRESIEFLDDSEVYNVASRMMKVLNWSGVAHIDLRIDKSDNQVKVIEINGRFWASVVASYLKAGVNFPMILVKLSLGEEVDIPTQKVSKQLSLRDYFHLKIKSKEKVRLEDTKFSFYKHDLTARAYQVLEKITRKIS